ncbi:MAG: type II toxin-antitoxin system VapC family toxin [Lachnospiraceae bacterium]|jgi:PIN domain nuclease of toxin-antitoxin system|nr:type II toxin-antitoxin system VapC family toxin [Lachnospiraceae bacterium]
MEILLDTHALWWFLNGSDKMPNAVKETILTSENTIYVSIASIWEVAIKMSIGKLKFDGGIDRFVEAIEDEAFMLLDIIPKHIETVTKMDYIHRDLFDRMLVAQAIVEELPVITIDSNMVKYDITPIWKS